MRRKQRWKPTPKVWVTAGAVTAGLAVAGAVMLPGGGGGDKPVSLSNNGVSTANKAAGQAKIVCPEVAGELGTVPAAATAEVKKNLHLMHMQVMEANKRLVTSAGQGGPNFVQNAILGPLADKRKATLDRMAIAMKRAGAQAPAGLDELATCKVDKGAAAGGAEATASAAPTDTASAAPTETATAGAGAADAGAEAAGQGQIACPDVAGPLGAVPAAAQAEVSRNLTLLDTQIMEANKRLATSAGQGGPNFVQNAILGPLADKRKSTIDRISLAIGRTGAQAPAGLDQLATCKVDNGAAAGGAEATASAAPTATATATAPAQGGEAGAGAGTGANAAGQISCPDVAGQLGVVPAAAQAEVTRNLNLLQTQISEADKRLATSAGQGGPNFVQNAILGPLADKRKSTIDRISLAIGRTGTAAPAGLDQLATCEVTK